MIERDVWIVRSMGGELLLFLEPPYRVSITSEGEDLNSWGPVLRRYVIPSDLYPEIKWKDEPVKLKLKIE